ncbi:hypothetical protein B0H12DRAFT_1071966 [Mycena haematopus]|nr:hypothetical protein B0H12DRAFT_1071966 [Mycena haematopus]
MAAIFDDENLDGYSDGDLEAYIRQSPRIETVRQEHTKLLSPSLVVKVIPWPVTPWDEVDALKRAAAAGIRVPAVRRVVPLPRNAHAIVMDRVQGKTLEQLWPELGLWQTLSMAWQLRRAVTSPSRPRAPAASTRARPAQYSTPAAFTDYLNWWLVQARPSHLSPRPELLLTAPTHHVLVHQDLAPRNMIIDGSDRLWLIDWGHAGYYPAFMETLGMIDDPSKHSLGASAWTAWWGRIRWRAISFHVNHPLGIDNDTNPYWPLIWAACSLPLLPSVSKIRRLQHVEYPYYGVYDRSEAADGLAVGAGDCGETWGDGGAGACRVGVHRGQSVIPKSVQEGRIISNFKQIELSEEDFEKQGAACEIQYSVPVLAMAGYFVV